MLVMLAFLSSVAKGEGPGGGERRSNACQLGKVVRSQEHLVPNETEVLGEFMRSIAAGRDLAPSPTLAPSPVLAPGTFAVFEVSPSAARKIQECFLYTK